MPFNLLLILPDLISFIKDFITALKTEDKLTYEEAKGLTNEFLPILVSLGIPGLNKVKWLKYAPGLIVFLLEFIKKEVQVYKTQKEEEEKVLQLQVKEKLYHIKNGT